MSKYEKSNWIDNETVLKAEHMRKIEQGIVDLYNEIENVIIGEVDLSRYATTEYVNDEISKIELLEGPQGPQGLQGEKGDTPSIAHLEANISNKISEIDELMHQLTNGLTIDGGEL